MKAILLAAGRSRRVKPIEDKNFLRFCGKFLIEWQLESLKQNGFDEILLIGGAHNLKALEQVGAAFGAKVLEQKKLDEGMAGAILTVEEEVDDHPVLVVSSNDLVEPRAFELMHEALNSSADAALLAVEMQEYFPGGYLKVENGRIVDIVEKPGEGNEPSNLVNIVLHLHKKPKLLIETLKKIDSSDDDRYEKALAELMKTQHFEAVPYNGFWQPLKFPWHVLDVNKYFLGRLESYVSPSAKISETAVIKGPVYIADDVKIFDHATIQGPAYLGKGAIVANNALVRESCIGEGSVVGYSTEVARSYVGDDTWFHSNYVGDSVIGNHCSFGASAVCANLRLDEGLIGESKRNKLGVIFGDRVRVGVNTSLMPGTRIGSDSFIASGLTIGQDIEPGKYVSGKSEIQIRENKSPLDPMQRQAMMQSLKKSS